MSFPACPCCGQPWYATERRTLIGPVFVTPHGWARLSRYEMAAVSFLLDGEPVDRATLARHIDPDKPPTDKRAKATAESINRKLRPLHWRVKHRAGFGYGLEEVLR